MAALVLFRPLGGVLVSKRLRRSAAAALVIAIVAATGVATAASGAAIELISRSAVQPPGGTPSGPSTLGGVSADGRFVVFASRAADIVLGQVDEDHRPGDFITPSSWDVFLYDRTRRVTTLVSHGSASIRVAGGSGRDSRGPVISADGNWIAFVSRRSDLVPGQVGNDGNDVFLYDRLRNASVLVSHRFSSPLSDSSGGASAPAMSADGRYVAYYSDAIDIVAADSERDTKLFVFDRSTGINTLVARGVGSVFESLGMSADGRFVVFQKLGDIFVHDRVGGATALVTHAAGSPTTSANDGSLLPVMSADGSTIAYMSWATNLVAGQIDGADTYDVFLYDRATGLTTLVSRSTSSAVTAANGESSDLAISANGSSVVFLSRATDLVAGVTDGNQSYDEYLYDRNLDRLSLVSHVEGAPFAAANRPAYGPSVTPDGGRFTFTTAASDVLPGLSDPAPWFNLFVRDGGTGAATLIGLQDRTGPGVQGVSPRPRFTPDGKTMAFGGLAGLTSADANQEWDVYLYGDPAADPGPFVPCTLLDTRRPADAPALRSEVKRLIVAAGACEMPPTAKWISVKVTALQATGKGNLRMFPGNQARAASSATLALKKGGVRTASYQLRLATDGAGTLALLPFVAARGSVHVVLEVLGYSE